MPTTPVEHRATLSWLPCVGDKVHGASRSIDRDPPLIRRCCSGPRRPASPQWKRGIELQPQGKSFGRADTAAVAGGDIRRDSDVVLAYAAAVTVLLGQEIDVLWHRSMAAGNREAAEGLVNANRALRRASHLLGHLGEIG